MNWGYKIVLVFVVFVSGMAFMAYKSSQQNSELVTDDYYAQELIFQKKIDEVKRTAALSDTVSIKSYKDQLIIELPSDFAGKQITGLAEVYCPSNEKRDSKNKFNTTNCSFEISAPAVHNLLHYIKLSWQVEGVDYYYEQKIII